MKLGATTFALLICAGSAHAQAAAKDTTKTSVTPRRDTTAKPAVGNSAPRKYMEFGPGAPPQPAKPAKPAPAEQTKPKASKRKKDTTAVRRP